MPLSLFQQIRDSPAEFDKDLLRRTFQNAEQPAIHFFGGEAGRHLKPFSSQLGFVYPFNCESTLCLNAVGATNEVQTIPIEHEHIGVNFMSVGLVCFRRLIMQHYPTLLEQGSPESGQHFLLGGIISRGALERKEGLHDPFKMIERPIRLFSFDPPKEVLYSLRKRRPLQGSELAFSEEQRHELLSGESQWRDTVVAQRQLVIRPSVRFPVLA